MAKPIPKAGRPHKTPGTKAAPVKPGVTKGTPRKGASVDVPWNPLGAVNGPDGGLGKPAPKKAAGRTVKNPGKPKGGTGS